MIIVNEHTLCQEKMSRKKCPNTYNAHNINNIPLAADMQRTPGLGRYSEHTAMVYNIKKHGIQSIFQIT